VIFGNFRWIEMWSTLVLDGMKQTFVNLVSLCSDAHMKLEKPAHVAKRIIHKDNFCIQ
jgi:hypothetical protein